jgi:autotransporter-associated beta strand protein
MKLETHSLEVLEVRIAPATFHWALSGNGTWNSPASWFNETTGLLGDGFPNAVDDVAKFTSASVDRAIVVIDGMNITVGSILFDAANEFFVSGANSGALTLASSTTATIEIVGGNGHAHEIRTPVTLASPFVFDHGTESPFYFRVVSFDDNGFGFTKTGIGPVDMTLAVSSSFTGPIKVSAGLLQVGGSKLTGPIIIGGEGASAEFRRSPSPNGDPEASITVNAGGTFSLRTLGSYTMGDLTIHGGVVGFGSGTIFGGFTVSSLTMIGGSIGKPADFRNILTVNGDLVATSDANGPAVINFQMEMKDVPRVFTVPDGPQLVDFLFRGVVFTSGAGMIKEGDGTMRIDGGGPSRPTISGPTIVNAGILEIVGYPNGLPNIRGPLVIGDGIGNIGSAVVRLLGSNTIEAGIAVTVHEDGLFDLNGNSATISALTIHGGSVTTGALATDLIVTDSAALSGAHLSAQAAGSRIFLPPNPVVTAAAGPSRIDGLGSVEMANGESILFTVHDTPHDVDLIIAVPIYGSASAVVRKDGAGTLALDAINSYGGTTTVLAGGLRVNGQIGALTLENGDGVSSSRLIGTGIIGAITSPGGAYLISPAGQGVGKLHTGSLSSMTGDVFTFDLNGKRPTQSDSIAVTGTVDLSGAGALDVRLNYVPKRGHKFTLIENDGTDPVIGRFAGAEDGALIWIDSHRFRISYTGGDGNDVTLTAKPPLPHATGKSIHLPIKLESFSLAAVQKLFNGKFPNGAPLAGFKLEAGLDFFVGAHHSQAIGLFVQQSQRSLGEPALLAVADRISALESSDLGHSLSELFR